MNGKPPRPSPRPTPRPGLRRDTSPQKRPDATGALAQAVPHWDRAATWVAGVRGARRAVFAVLLGVLCVLAFAPMHAWPVLFLTFGGLVWLLYGCHAAHLKPRPRLQR